MHYCVVIHTYAIRRFSFSVEVNSLHDYYWASDEYAQTDAIICFVDGMSPDGHHAIIWTHSELSSEDLKWILSKLKAFINMAKSLEDCGGIHALN